MQNSNPLFVDLQCMALIKAVENKRENREMKIEGIVFQQIRLEEQIQ
jgi:hypothetical protein